MWKSFAILLYATSLFAGGRLELNQNNVQLRMKQALKYLDDSQIKTDRLTDNLRLAGEWPSYVRGSLLPDGAVSAIYDSNAFVPMFVVYPLYWLDDSALDPTERRVRAMKQLTVDMLTDRAKNGYLSANGELNFWPTFQGFHGPQQIFHTLPFSRLLGPIFDIANDADDTSVFYITAQKHARETGAPVRNARDDFPAIFRWLDTGRFRSDTREAQWKPAGTGAFLTWLTNEDLPRNRQPIAFQLANNVDCTVVANVLYSLGLKGATDVPGYQDSCRLARTVIAQRQYPLCAFYYPPEWLYPYVISRAFRDGNNQCLAENATTRDGATVNAMDTLVDQLLAGQQDGVWTDTARWANDDADRNTTEPGFRGDPRSYSTALAINSLLNLGPRWTGNAALSRRVQLAVSQGITFLLNNAVEEDQKLFWQGGVFFSSSYQEVARWKSRPYTTAVVLEALLKYRMDYHRAEHTARPLALTRDDVPVEWLRRKP